MKYILVAHGDTQGEDRVIICDTKEERILQTIEAIYGEKKVPEEFKEGWKQELEDLETDGILRFEGDPPLEWLAGTIEQKTA